MSILKLRQAYHEYICRNAIRVTKGKKGEYPNFADGDNKSSRAIAWSIAEEIGFTPDYSKLREQTIGDVFEDATKEFLENSFLLIEHLRPGNWYYSTDQTAISGFVQYQHLAELDKKVKSDRTLASVLGVGYIVKPDIVVGRYPVSDAEINKNAMVLSSGVSESTPLRNKNQETMLLHASISCKWTIRSDRSQNARTEALNLIRNRKGNLPHIVAVTAEPLPTRIATLALGTGDIDCVYHFALPELKAAIEKIGNEDQMDMLMMIIEGDRLRDISDLPFDLAV